jgi:hypothetical protein
MNIFELIAIRKHNAKIEKQFGKDPRPDDIQASNYMEAIEKAGREGLTIEGDVYKTMTRVGKNRWRAGVEKFK